jgi:predicted RNase H-like nuclease (RuvC/YqgF family)
MTEAQQPNPLQNELDQTKAQLKYFQHEGNATKQLLNETLQSNLALRTAVSQFQEENTRLTKLNGDFVSNTQNLLTKISELETALADYKRRDEQLTNALNEVNSNNGQECVNEQAEVAA